MLKAAAAQPCAREMGILRALLCFPFKVQKTPPIACEAVVPSVVFSQT